jgi:hypothetical protein
MKLPIIRALIIGALIAAWMINLSLAQPDNTNLVTQTRPAGLSVAMSSQLVPLSINQMHNWIVTLTTEQGLPAEGASIQVQGGMPAHNHGLATNPQITDYLGDGQYLLQGMRFHMNGEWTIQLNIEFNNRRHIAEFNLQL